MLNSNLVFILLINLLLIWYLWGKQAPQPQPVKNGLELRDMI